MRELRLLVLQLVLFDFRKRFRQWSFKCLKESEYLLSLNLVGPTKNHRTRLSNFRPQ